MRTALLPISLLLERGVDNQLFKHFQLSLSKRNVAHHRLPGPAGHKSRCEDPAIDKLSKITSAAGHDKATCVFTNVDMFADAKHFKKVLKTIAAGG